MFFSALKENRDQDQGVFLGGGEGGLRGDGVPFFLKN